MIARGPSPGPTLAIVLALAAVLSTAGCRFAVEHPAASAGIVAGTLGFGTCKLASDSIGGCLAVGGGAGAFLALVAAAAIWLGGDGNSVAPEEQAQPLPPDDRPRRPRTRPVTPAEPEPAAPASPAPASPAPASPAPASPTPASPTPPSASPLR